MPLFVTKRIKFSIYENDDDDDDDDDNNNNNGGYVAVHKQQRCIWSVRFIVSSGSLYPRQK